MDFRKENLLDAGFTKMELQILQNNIDSFGGTMQDAIRDLAKRFRVFIIVLFFTAISSVFLICFKWGDVWYIFSCLMSFLFVDLILLFAQPPIISYKSWRFCRR